MINSISFSWLADVRIRYLDEPIVLLGIMQYAVEDIDIVSAGDVGNDDGQRVAVRGIDFRRLRFS